MNITKENAYSIMQELIHQSSESESLKDDIATAMQVVEHNGSLSRSDEKIFRYICENRLTFDWDMDIDANTTQLIVHGGKLWLNELVSYPYTGDDYTTLKQAVEHIMDMNEL